MVVARLTVLLIAVASLAFVGVYIVNDAFVESGEDHTITNETWTPNASNVTELSDSKIEDAVYGDKETVTVYNSSDTFIEAPGNWSWLRGNGTIKALSGGELDGEPSANITYEYELVGDEQRAFIGFFRVLFDSYRWLFIFGIMIIFFLALMRVAGG